MQTVLIAVHIIVTICLIGVVLLQRTNSDGLQGINAQSGMGGIMSPASSANFMTKLTSILAAVFLINCLILSNLAARSSKGSIADKIATKIEVVKTDSGHPPVAE